MNTNMLLLLNSTITGLACMFTGLKIIKCESFTNRVRLSGIILGACLMLISLSIFIIILLTDPIISNIINGQTFEFTRFIEAYTIRSISPAITAAVSTLISVITFIIMHISYKQAYKYISTSTIKQCRTHNEYSALSVLKYGHKCIIISLISALILFLNAVTNVCLLLRIWL